MIEPTTLMSTKAELADRLAAGPSSTPAWLAELRREALDQFRAIGWPNLRQEEWRWTDVAPLTKVAYRIPAPPDLGLPLEEWREQIAPYSLRLRGWRELVFVNGTLIPQLSEWAGPDLRISALSAAVDSQSALIRRHLARGVALAQDGFTALNTAGFQDGAFIHVPAGLQSDRPLHLLFFTPDNPGPVLVQPRNLVVVDAGAKVVLVHSYAGASRQPALTNAVLEMVLGAAAQVELIQLQREAAAAFHVSNTAVHLERQAAFQSLTVNLGGALVRHNLQVRLKQPGGQATLLGLSVQTGRQHVDNHTLLDHASEQCRSSELYKSLLGGRAEGVFKGKILVRSGAQKTDAKQTSRTILLSEDAVMNAQPQLEIYADDVKCTHGSTIGPLDEEQLFYLRCRGISVAAAQRLLTYAFAGDVLNRLRHEGMRQYLETLVRGALKGLSLVEPPVERKPTREEKSTENS